MRLPAATQFVLLIGQRPLQVIVYPVVGLVGGFLLIRFSLSLTEAGQRAWAHFLYAIPLVGTLLRSARLAGFAELLGILVDHEVPLPEALRLAGEASSDPLTRASSRRVQEFLSNGVPLAEALRGRGLVPEWVAWMMGLGERRGTLGKSLHQIADIYRRQVEMRAALLRSVLPPFLVIGTAGVFVTFFVFALMLPMVKLLEGLSM
jgi:general secretion pathway protein F